MGDLFKDFHSVPCSDDQTDITTIITNPHDSLLAHAHTRTTTYVQPSRQKSSTSYHIGSAVWPCSALLLSSLAVQLQGSRLSCQ